MDRFIKYNILAPLLALVLLLCGCQKDNLTDPENSEDSDEVTLEFAYSISQNMFMVESKGVYLDDYAFNNVGNVGVLIYEAEGTTLDKQFLRYYRPVFDLKDDPVNGKGTFKVTMPKSKNGEKYVFDFIINGRSYFTNWVFSHESTSGEMRWGDTREAVHENSWITQSTGSFALGTLSAGITIPMWASIETPMEIKNDMPVITEMGKLIRAVSKFHIGLNLDDNLVGQGMSNFQLRTVQVFCMPSQYRIIPSLTNLDAAGENVIAPTIPSYYSYGTGSPASLATQITFQGDSWVKNSNYALGENVPDIDASNSIDRHCFVIGGVYADPVDGSSGTYYYRVDVMDPIDPTKKFQILRNHNYIINITGDIDRPGYTTAVAASTDPMFRGVKAAVITLGVDDPDLNYVVYNGTFYLGVSEKELTFPVTASSKELVIKTNFYATSANSGWYATVSDPSVVSLSCTSHTSTYASWSSDGTQFEFKPTSAVANQAVTLDVTMMANGTGGPRTETITFRSRGTGTTVPPFEITVDLVQD
ncbi:MAG: hypothetical protein LIO79_05215 [Rikenellaceae bacterium]|nr:hypothetical protein [Rikenellaceae bacterium]